MRSCATEVTQLQDALSQSSAEASQLQERLDKVGDRWSDIPGLVLNPTEEVRYLTVPVILILFETRCCLRVIRVGSIEMSIIWLQVVGRQLHLYYNLP